MGETLSQKTKLSATVDNLHAAVMGLIKKMVAFIKYRPLFLDLR